MNEDPLAFHITFGTYGTRLHGDERDTVDRDHNHFLEPFVSSDPARMDFERSLMRFTPIYLSDEQRSEIETVIPSICDRGSWRLHARAAGPDHVHVCLTGAADGKTIRKWFKRWLGEELSKR